MKYLELKQTVKNNSNKQQAIILQRFFKTGKGEYGEGDVFAGIKVPLSRKIANDFKDLDFTDLQKVIQSKIHEERLITLFILIAKYKNSDDAVREKLFNFYLKNIRYVNNWDLVDLSAEKIIGAYLIDKDKRLLFDLVKSNNIWERRIAIMSTFCFIKANQFAVALKISELLLKDKHDLIHKASGWMLREIGKRDIQAEEVFLQKYYKNMPRTMLRYAIEKFPEKKRLNYLKGNF
ncbi:MAG: DNA alkylation repair protein [Ignavibacteriaceae bacterium]